MGGAALAATALGIAVLAAGCGGSTASNQPEVGGEPNVGVPISDANCTHWKEASTEERLGTIRELREFAGGPVTGSGPKDPAGRGAVLEDEQAYDLFENYCAEDFARAFKLYKLYERAAAFAGQPPG